jgi:hypothetical protein
MAVEKETFQESFHEARDTKMVIKRQALSIAHLLESGSTKDLAPVLISFPGSSSFALFPKDL